jgi:DNA polymerase-1
MRKTGKIINFGIIYGIGAPGLTQQIPRPAKYRDAEYEEWKDVCQEFINMYFEAHAGVKRFVRNSNRFVKYNGWAENYFGRIRHLPHYKAVKLTKRDELKYMEAKAQRQGTNFVVQGTAADVFKMACVKVHKLLKGKKSKMVCYVHDEAHVYMRNDEVFLVPAIKYVMEDFKFKVPLIADCSISLNSWADKQPVDGSDLKKICAMANIEWSQALEDQAQEALSIVKSWKSGN